MNKITVGAEKINRGRLKEARTKKYLSQRELAKRAGVSGSLIGQIETGSRRTGLATIHKIAEILEVSVEWLTHIEEPEEPAASRPLPEIRQYTPAYTVFQAISEAVASRKISVINIYSKNYPDRILEIRIDNGNAKIMQTNTTCDANELFISLLNTPVIDAGENPIPVYGGRLSYCIFAE